ncbi:MAG: DUF2169 domain-containing protein [Deltaproteobacteria bacterium]|jgi:uncharacterized protein YjbI with pentapeptide repeats|nr:DUF2169 domain-containing protein [Deltaproteobacteria bacterium]MBW2536003.1 DUF2169 domain-containing protein [Deltaproteobacteria bacterium]
MKVVKPQRLGLIHRVVEHERRCSLVVSVLVYVPLDAPRKLLTEQSLWKDVGEEIPSGIVDEGVPKPVGEVLLTAHAFAPKGEPARGVMVRVKVGSVDKRLAVVGDRHWKGGKPSEPEPFESMPIDWAHAFGGEGYKPNPLGKGFAPVETEHGPIHYLPNVEDPDRPIAAKSDRPEVPAGFGAYDCMWPQRFGLVGRQYDTRWLETRFPGPAADFDAHYYCVAPVDQHSAGFFAGDEQILLEGMHPAASRIEGKLEPLRVRVFVTRTVEGEERFEEAETQIDTIHLLPHLKRAVVVYRGTLRVAEDDADDVVHLMVGAEDPNVPKTVDHYRRVLADRLDTDMGALASLNDQELMPPQAEGWSARIDAGDLAEFTRLENHALEASQRGRERELAKAREHLAAAGYDVEELFTEPDPIPIPDPQDVESIMEFARAMEEREAEMAREAEQAKGELEAGAKAAFEAAGFNHDEAVAQALAEGAGPPAFSADEHLGMLHDMARIAAEGGEPMEELERDLTDPRYEEVLRELEQRTRDGYRQTVHLLPAAVVNDEQRQQLRVQVQAAADGGESLKGRNLTGADLSELDLSGVDLSEALLEGANLRGVTLRDAKLERAVLARADLTDANLDGGSLQGANLGDATLVRTVLTGADLTDAVLARSTIDGAIFVGATLCGADLFETSFVEADLSHTNGHELMLLRADLRRVTLTGAQLTRAMLVECDLTKVDLAGCDLSGAQLIRCKADEVCFVSAKLVGAMVVHESSLVGADFVGADATRANFYKTPLTRARLDEGTFDGANLSKCDLRGAKLGRIRARESLLMRTNLEGADAQGADLLGSIAQKAILRATDLRGSNLARADISLAQIDGTTKVDGALMLDTRVDPKHQEPPK